MELMKKEKKNHHVLYLGKIIFKVSYFGQPKMEKGRFYTNERKNSSQGLHSR
jgi:hypothetical protein